LIVLALIPVGQAFAQSLSIVGYNVESGGADPETVGERIADFQGADIWGLCEVASANWVAVFENAAADGEDAEFGSIIGTTGGADKLAIIYDRQRLELVRSFELHDINTTGRVRAPLVAQFKLDSGAEFLFMVNHLYRSKAGEREEQARRLNAWARAQTLPAIAVGDYNFDWDVDNGDADHDAAFDVMVADDAWKWVRPDALVQTQHSDRYDSVLDFVFVAGQARDWTGRSQIVVVPNDFPDDEDSSDHRPVSATFSLGAATPADTDLHDILNRVRDLERELTALRQDLEAMVHD